MGSQGSNRFSMGVSGKPEFVNFKVRPETGYGFEPPGPQQWRKEDRGDFKASVIKGDQSGLKTNKQEMHS